MTTINGPRINLLSTLTVRAEGLRAQDLSSIAIPVSTDAGVPASSYTQVTSPAHRAPVNAIPRYAMPDIDIVVYGRGEIGDKSTQLLQKTFALRTLGISTPKSHILAQDFFDGFFRINGLGDNLVEAESTPGVSERILQGRFTPEEISIIEMIVQEMGDAPLAIRSSAVGDARGTGIYSTEFSKCSVTSVLRALRNVLSSYFSFEAEYFREKKGIKSGFGILIQPVVGQIYHIARYGGRYYAPPFSGYGYTSTSRYSDGYISVSVGLSGGVSSRLILRISESEAKPYGDLATFTWMFDDGPSRHSIWAPVTNNAPGRPPRVNCNRPISFNAIDTRAEGDEFYMVQNPSCIFTGLGHTILFYFAGYAKSFYFNPIFSAMRKMQELFGAAQYFEWAWANQQWWVTQIADVPASSDFVSNNQDLGPVMMSADTVEGSGDITCPSGIIVCQTADDIKAVNTFNANNQGYVLVYSGDLLLSKESNLKLNDFSNARALIEGFRGLYVGHPISHFCGKVNQMNMPIGLLKGEIRSLEGLEGFQERGGVLVYPHPVRVIASEKDNVLRVHKIIDTP